MADARRKVIFDSIQGQWQLSRTISTAVSSYPSGKLTGHAKIEARPVTSVSIGNESLYSEEGEFITDQNLTMRARRQYLYRYQREVDSLTIWFVRSDDHATVDYLFHRLDFTDEGRDLGEPKPEDDETIVTARGHHLCVNDDYNVEYKFTFQHQNLREWTVRYIVKGPHKDYIADSKYTRSTA